MKNFQPDQFKDQLFDLHYDSVLKEIFGNDLQSTYNLAELRHTPRVLALGRRFSVVPLWYLKILADQKPARIVDIGCGGNLFKPVIKRLFGMDVHGIDPTPGNLSLDEFDFFDSDFSAGHKNMYESVFSINALHFIPLEDLKKRIEEFYNIIAPGGYGFLALNIARFVECSNSSWLVKMFGSINPTQTQLQNHVCNELAAMPIEFIVNHVLINQTYDEYMDGNIRLVFKK